MPPEFPPATRPVHPSASRAWAGRIHSIRETNSPHRAEPECHPTPRNLHSTTTGPQSPSSARSRRSVVRLSSSRSVWLNSLLFPFHPLPTLGLMLASKTLFRKGSASHVLDFHGIIRPPVPGSMTRLDWALDLSPGDAGIKPTQTSGSAKFATHCQETGK